MDAKAKQQNGRNDCLVILFRFCLNHKGDAKHDEKERQSVHVHIEKEIEIFQQEIKPDLQHNHSNKRPTHLTITSVLMT